MQENNKPTPAPINYDQAYFESLQSKENFGQVPGGIIDGFTFTSGDFPTTYDPYDAYRGAAYNKLRGYTEDSFDAMRRGVGAQIGETRAGYDRARREVSGFADASRTQALDREKQLTANLQSGLASSGLGNTTVGSNLQRGVSADTTRRLQEIDSNMARMYSSLTLGESGTISGLLGSIAGSFVSQANVHRQLLADQYASIAGLARAEAAQTSAGAQADYTGLEFIGDLVNINLG